MDDSGFFEEFNQDDVEEIELSAAEEDFEEVEDFKESAIFQEIDGILKESTETEVSENEEVIHYQDEFLEDINNSDSIKVLYVNKSSLQNNTQTLSDNQIVLLSSEQFEVLIDEISACRPTEVATVSQNDYTIQLDDLKQAAQTSVLVNIMIFSLCFGYFIKETIFRGI